VVLGTALLCGGLLVEAAKRIDAGGDADAIVAAIATEIHARGDKMPGFGHPLHRPVDPRAERILALADREQVAGRHVGLARRFAPVVAKVWGRALPMNVSMPIAAVLLDLDFPSSMLKAVPLLARTGGLLAHIAEEQQNPIGFLMASKAEAAIAYEGGKAQ
jgi:citrate synthase